MREGALNASVAILIQANGVESKLSSYALKTVTLFAQNQFRTSDLHCASAAHPFSNDRAPNWQHLNAVELDSIAAEATPKLINRRTVKALVQCSASKDVSDFTGFRIADQPFFVQSIY